MTIPSSSQPDMFAIPLPPDPGGTHSTHYIHRQSSDAYERYFMKSRARKEKIVLAYINDEGWYGTTNEHMWLALRRRHPGQFESPNNVAPVTYWLRKKGLVVWSGRERKLRNGHENTGKVWVTAPVWVKWHTEVT